VAAFLAKPPTASPRWGHPFLQGATLWAPCAEPAVPPRDAAGQVPGVLANLGGSGINPPTLTSGPFGPALAFASTSQQVQWAGSGYVNLPVQFTYHMVLRPDLISNSPRLLATGTALGFLTLFLGSAAGFAILFTNGTSANWGAGAPTLGRWYGVVVAVNLATHNADFYAMDYTAGTLTSVKGVTVPATGATTGAGPTAVFNPDSAHPFTGALSDAGLSSAPWTEADALAYLADPSAAFRPRRLRPGLLAAVVPAGGGPALSLDYRRRRAG
jgi:hypothetical protein